MLSRLKQYFEITPIRPLIYKINKPLGFSSFTIVDIFKHTTKTKAGHAGTLDPMATGDLLILLGHTTKLSNYYLALEKTYQTTILFGLSSDSMDLETPLQIQTLPQPHSVLKQINKKIISHALKTLQKQELFEISSYSALKHKGRPLYKQPNVKKIKKMKLISFTINKITDISVSDLYSILLKKEEKLKHSQNLYIDLTTNLNIPLRIKQSKLFTDLLQDIQNNKAILNSIQNNKLSALSQFAILDLTMHVSSGSYVRTFVQYLSQILKTPATTIDIIRTNTYN